MRAPIRLSGGATPTWKRCWSLSLSTETQRPPSRSQTALSEAASLEVGESSPQEKEVAVDPCQQDDDVEMARAEAMQVDGSIARMEKLIGYSFKDPDLIWEALQARRRTVKTDADRKFPEGNYRMAMGGDSVLKTVILEDMLLTGMSRFTISKTMRHLVSNQHLFRAGRMAKLEDLVSLKYLQSVDSARSEKVLASTIEAVIWAVYLDAGKRTDVVRGVLKNLGIWDPVIGRGAFRLRPDKVVPPPKPNGYLAARPLAKFLPKRTPLSRPKIPVAPQARRLPGCPEARASMLNTLISHTEQAGGSQVHPNLSASGQGMHTRLPLEHPLTPDGRVAEYLWKLGEAPHEQPGEGRKAAHESAETREKVKTRPGRLMLYGVTILSCAGAVLAARLFV